MATPTAAQVRTISLTSLFDSIADAVIDEAVSQALYLYTAITGEPEHTTIVALTACHWLAKAGWVPGFGGGVVASASAGGVSASWAVAAITPFADVDLSTPWGARAKALLDALPPSVRGGGWDPWA